MAIVKAPYNFVPLNSDVVTPYWADYISHDLPFEDGQSGEIEVSLTTHSPLFIRDGKKSEGEVQQFCQTEDGKYFIPGSSLKGMIRSVMEVMTFSKMRLVNDHRFAYRDFHNNQLYQVSEISKTAECGWLRIDENGDYILEECGTPGRVHMRELEKLKDWGLFKEEHQGFDYYSFFTRGETGFGFDGNSDEHKSAEFKYGKLANPHPVLELAKVDKKGSKHDYRKKFTIEGLANQDTLPGTEVGTLVLTGQPDARNPAHLNNNNKPSGKVFEFVFLPSHNTRNLTAESTGEKPKVIEDMEWAYLNQKNTDEQSIDWLYFKRRLQQGEKIPVFFHKSHGEVTSMGLSLLYKFAYNNSVKELIEKRQSENGISMAEGIFGHIQEEQKDHPALKGRVHIEHGFAREGAVELDEKIWKEVLASPKASYYPVYVRQSLRNNQVSVYKTFNDDFATIAGRKRYPIRNFGTSHNPPGEKVKNPDKVTTKFRPLKKGTFTFSIRYHNLKKVELGALISAITFHDHPDAFHSLGMGKPLGLGKVRLSVNNIDNYTDALKSFEAFMTASLGYDWSDSSEIRELITMACEHKKADRHLRYMNLDRQDFANAKKKREGLPSYSKLEGVGVLRVNALVSEEEVEEAQKIIASEKQLFRQKQSSKDFIQQKLDFYEKELIRKLDEHTNQLKNKLKEQREKIKEEIRKSKKEAKKIKAVEKGPNFSKVNPKDRVAFEKQLKKEMSLYRSQLYPNTNEKDLKKEKPDGWLPEEFHQELEQLVLEIARKNPNGNERERWTRDLKNNAMLRKVKEWIGETKVIQLLKQIRK